MKKFKIFKHEVETFCDLVNHGYKLWLVEEYVEKPFINNEGFEEERYSGEGWQYVWGVENSEKLVSDNADEIRNFFSTPFEAEHPKLFLSKGGTHCGMLSYMFGWVNTAKQEDLEEAVVPQMNG